MAASLRHIPSWLLAPIGSGSARLRERQFFAELASGFGIVIETSGRISDQAGTLFVMNHISWADIPVMLATLDADFVARGDMRDWPVLGPLARRLDPVFVARENRSSVALQALAISARLQRGRSVILCAEGTTSEGNTILPFRSSLFAAAQAASVVQPVLLRYLQPDGAPNDSRRRREVAWIDDDSLLFGAAQLARSTTLARLDFLEGIAPLGLDRKNLAMEVRESLLSAYATAPNRAR